MDEETKTKIMAQIYAYKEMQRRRIEQEVEETEIVPRAHAPVSNLKRPTEQEPDEIDVTNILHFTPPPPPPAKEPESVRKSALTDSMIQRMVDAVRDETAARLQEHRLYTRELLIQLVGDLGVKFLEQDVAELASQLAEFRGETNGRLDAMQSQIDDLRAQVDALAADVQALEIDRNVEDGTERSDNVTRLGVA